MKKSNASSVIKSKPQISRPGVHAKTKTSSHKGSRNYKKKYRGQG
jgi:hypothetical protein